MHYYIHLLFKKKKIIQLFQSTGVSVTTKECPVFQTVVRFQEYSSGFHNFNNRVFLTLPLCELLLSSLAVRQPEILCVIQFPVYINTN